MSLGDAIEAHVHSTLYSSSFGDPREIVDVGPIRVIRDAPGRKRDPRKETFLISGVAPEIALKAIDSYEPRHWALSVIEPLEADHDALKAKYKKHGYRLIIRFPFFVYDLSKSIDLTSKVKVDRVVTAEQANLVKQAAGRCQIPLSLLRDGDAPIRLYAHFEGGKAIGWVQSVRANANSAWVSGLYVTDSHRKKGIASALMAKMLKDDARYGANASVLLASNEGSKLYRRLGYEQIGLMQIFTPVKGKN